MIISNVTANIKMFEGQKMLLSLKKKNINKRRIILEVENTADLENNKTKIKIKCQY